MALNSAELEGLRRELAAKVAKAKTATESDGIAYRSYWGGFHPLTLACAAIPLLLGTVISLCLGFREASDGSTQHHKLVCAHEIYLRNENRFWDLLSAYD